MEVGQTGPTGVDYRSLCSLHPGCILLYLYYLFLWLRQVFIVACRLSLVVASRGYSLLLAWGLLVILASPVGEHGLWRAGSVAAVHGLRCSVAAVHRLHCSVAVVHRLSCSAHVSSSQIRNRTRVPRISRWILNHWTTRDILTVSLISSVGSSLTNPVSGLVLTPSFHCLG